ncbi:glutamine--fructose-6-phosphate transaminase [Loktanella atrilutea]|uniref:Glutamine--fructose-6-phosphate transaminase n=1 Tax=Loktanella atrilutea TaxID=366533 RepID=A0A1M5D746_LOKAT|nr:SIS domain-containing protein [Loktanella atrilutea]SHF62818.1 glutamine--fructose-6-phosphate transaminase [Loktanella atrilutea]
MALQTKMYGEIRDIPQAVAQLLAAGGTTMADAGSALRDRDPAFLLTAARGSSDHAASCFKYATEILMGVPVASLGPSVSSIYGRQMRLDRGACVAVSQSGQSPDIVAVAQMAARGGALTFALTNEADSPLAAACDRTLHLHAGAEHSVAATKTFVNSCVAALWLLAEWAQDKVLLAALHDLPEALSRAVVLDWPELRAALDKRASLYCLGRGPAYAIAGEAALKFKETCLMHAEAYSSAEVLHGPVSLVDPGFPVLALCAADAAEASLAEAADAIAQKGAAVFATSDKVRHATVLPVVRTGHPLTDVVALIATFYAMVERVAVGRGIDPDTPRHLRKVTETT